MKHAKPPAAILGGNADDIEAAFYAALQEGDVERVMACWADEDDIVCVHPGGARLVGHAAIRAAFESMAGHGALQLRPGAVRKIASLGCVVHSVVERVELRLPDGAREAFVIATNVYHQTPLGWRLVARHASAGTQEEAQEAAAVATHLLH
ncbi:nuclear transport factor 2 family protein [Ramlibacter sp. H39-3-26]|uniref:YybH family protein n=1 Tax=Curvibacter soli TaxID=3031331 RepID=UPI0023DBEB44|nr:nuclear transport factor 2 family protein [Ramlibacter sp. H39-3-26]MDF1484574.1 nuclear transport factor 2 family protein [Ramlibacter sp. H39-3-26]